MEARLLHSLQLQRLFRRLEANAERGGRPVTFRMNEAEIAILEEAEKAAGISRSQLLRELVVSGGGTTNFAIVANMLDVLVEHLDCLPEDAQELIDRCGAALRFHPEGRGSGEKEGSPRKNIRRLLRSMRTLKHLQLLAAQCDLEALGREDRELLEFYLDRVEEPASEPSKERARSKRKEDVRRADPADGNVEETEVCIVIRVSDDSESPEKGAGVHNASSNGSAERNG